MENENELTTEQANMMFNFGYHIKNFMNSIVGFDSNIPVLLQAELSEFRLHIKQTLYAHDKNKHHLLPRPLRVFADTWNPNASERECIDNAVATFKNRIELFRASNLYNDRIDSILKHLDEYEAKLDVIFKHKSYGL